MLKRNNKNDNNTDDRNNNNNIPWPYPSIKEGYSRVWLRTFANTLSTCASMSGSRMRRFHSLPQPHYVTASHTSLGDKPPEHGIFGAKELSNHASKNIPMERNHQHMNQSSPLLPIFRAFSPSLHRHLSEPKATFKPSIPSSSISV